MAEKKKDVFDRIAPIYGLYYNYQKRSFQKALDRMQPVHDLSAYRNIIDIGCGTGALCSVLKERGLEVTGVDASKGMLDVAGRKEENKGIQFIQANLCEIPFADKSFDVSVASYVAHGLQQHEREILYHEMSRITKHLVLIFDYNERRSIMTNILEYMEGGDYFRYIKQSKQEMEKHFQNVRFLDVGTRARLSIGVPR